MDATPGPVKTREIDDACFESEHRNDVALGRRDVATGERPA